MTLPGRPVYGSLNTNICNVAAVPIANAVRQGHTSTVSPISMNEGSVEEHEIRAFSGDARSARAVMR
jgi:hypothetical protein